MEEIDSWRKDYLKEHPNIKARIDGTTNVKKDSKKKNNKSITFKFKKLMKKLFHQCPQDYYLYQTKGNVYVTIEQYDSALICFDKAIEIKPTNARAYINEGAIYELKGNKREAIENYLAATYLFLRNKYYDEAKEFGNRVLSLDPNNADAKEMLNQIP